MTHTAKLADLLPPTNAPREAGETVPADIYLMRVRDLQAENARLRAQVAELLDALKQTRDALYNETAGEEDSYSPWIIATRGKALAAIAKAEGRAQ